MADESGKVKIASAYVSVDVEADQAAVDATTAEIAEKLRAGLADAGKITIKADVDEESAVAAGELLAEAAQRAAGEVKIKADVDGESATAAGELLAEEARRTAGDVKIKADPDITSAAKAGEEMGAAASTAAKDAESGGGAGSWMPTLITAGITAGLPLVAGAASVLGVAAIGAAGVAMQRKNPSIDAAWQQLVSTFQSGATEASGVIDGPIVDALGSLTAVVSGAQPELDSMFQGVSSDIPIVASGFERLVQGVLPGFTDMINSSKPIVQGFSTVLGDIGQGVGSIASTIAHDSPEIGQDLASFGQVAKNSAVAIGGLVDIAAKLGVVVGPVLEGLTTAIGSVTTGFESNSSVLSVAEHANDLAAGKFLNVKAALDAEKAAADNASDSITKYTNGLQLETVSAGFTGASETIAEGLAKIGDKASDDTAKMQGLESVLEALTNPGGAAISTLAGISTSEQGLADQLKGLKGPIADQAGNFDLTSKRGAAAASAIEGIATNYTQYVAQAEKAKVPTDQINANLDTQYNNLLKTVEGFGLGEGAAKNYLAQLGVVPPEVQTTISMPNVEQAISDVINLHGQIVGVPTDHTVTTTALTADAIQHLKDLGYTVTTLPNGNVTVSANTGPAAASLHDLINQYSGATVSLRVAVTGGGSLSSMLHATGGIVPRKHASGSLTAVPPVAQIAPPSSFLTPNGGQDVFGDRPDTAEAYIPLDGSARSGALLDQVNAAMPGHGGGHTVSNTYAPTVNIGGTDPAQVVAELQSEFSWYNMIGRAA